MAVLLGLLVRPRFGRTDGLSDLEKECEHGAVLGLEPPALGVVESLVGKLEGGEVPERLSGPLEPLLEACTQRTERRQRPQAGTHHRPGVAQERIALAR